MFLVEDLDTGLELLQQFVVARHVLLWRIGEIGEQGKMQVKVGIAQKVKLHLLQQRCDLAGVGHKCGDDHHRAELGGNTFLEVHPGQHPGRHGVGDHPVDQGDGHSRSG